MEELRVPKNTVARSASLVALGTILSRILGFLRDLVIAHFFSRTATDAFVVAFRLPNFFRRLFGEGALTSSFIPVLSDFIREGKDEEAHKLASAVFTFLFMCLSLAAVLGIIFAKPAVGILASGDLFTTVSGKFDLTIHQTRILFGYVALLTLYVYGMGVLNAIHRFWLPAVAPALWNLAIILGVLFFRSFFSVSSDVLVWAAIAGCFVQGAVLVPSLLKTGFFPRFSKWWKNPHIRRVLKTFGPSIVGISVMQVGVLINTHFASQLEEGSNSWLFWADRLLELPLALFAVSIGTAALPTLSMHWSRGETEALHESSLQNLKLALFLTIPCAVGLFFLANPIVYTLFEHGKFLSHDTEMSAAVIKVYSLGLIFAVVVRVLNPSFYAMKNTRGPATAAVISLLFHVLGAIFLTPRFGIRGLALSSVLGAILNALILLSMYHVKIRKLGHLDLWKSILKYFVCALVLAMAIRVQIPLSQALGDSHWARATSLSVTILVALTTYLIAASLLAVPELKRILLLEK